MLSMQNGSPTGIVFHAGALYVAEDYPYRILRLDPASGRFTTVAGTGTEAPRTDRGPQPQGPGALDQGLPTTNAINAGDGGPALLATFGLPADIAIADDGSMYVADELLQRIRRIEPRTGIIGTVVGYHPNGVSNP
jgi:hypothetical protein